jgi:hypothetical protein
VGCSTSCSEARFKELLAKRDAAIYRLVDWRICKGEWKPKDRQLTGTQKMRRSCKARLLETELERHRTSQSDCGRRRQQQNPWRHILSLNIFFILIFSVRHTRCDSKQMFASTEVFCSCVLAILINFIREQTAGRSVHLLVGAVALALVRESPVACGAVAAAA